MLGYIDDIDNELTRKREEYGFLTAEAYKEKLADSEPVLENTDAVDNELEKKREEYGFLTSEEYKEKLAENETNN